MNSLYCYIVNYEDIAYAPNISSHKRVYIGKVTSHLKITHKILK